MAKRKALWLLILTDLLFITLLIVTFMDFDGIIPFILFQCLVPVELSVSLSAFYLVVPFLVTTRETHCNTYIAS